MNRDRQVQFRAHGSNGSPSSHTKTALLVVDIDYLDNWRPESIFQDSERREFADSLTAYLKLIRGTTIPAMPVIFAMLDSSSTPRLSCEMQAQSDSLCIGCDRKENKLAEFLEHRHNGSFEAVFVKREEDAFGNPELAPYLRSLGVKHLLLVGCNTFACVRATAYGAVRAGFTIIVGEDCIFPRFAATKTKEAWLQEVRKRIPPDSIVTVAARPLL